MLTETETVLASALMSAGMPSEQAEIHARTAPDHIKELAEGRSATALQERLLWATMPSEDVDSIIRASQEVLGDRTLTDVFAKVVFAVQKRMESIAGVKVPPSTALYAVAEKMLDTGYVATKEAAVPHLAIILSSSITPLKIWKEALELAETSESNRP